VVQGHLVLHGAGGAQLDHIWLLLDVGDNVHMAQKLLLSDGGDYTTHKQMVN
jgi:hypothetical protein